MITLVMMAASVSAADDAARDYLQLTSSFDPDCVALSGVMRQLVNAHRGRVIEAYLYRKMGETRQPGRRMETVPPGGKPINLGCTRLVDGSAQDWEIVEAEFQD
jgi:hypothetical protein